jgi:hypothetical protein
MGLIDGQDYVVRLVDLPVTVRAFTTIDNDGMYNIYVSASLSKDAQIASFRHEVGHIIRNDFFNRTDIRIVEAV